MGFKLGDIVHHARAPRPRPDADEAPPETFQVAPESPVLTDGPEDDDAPDAGDPAG